MTSTDVRFITDLPLRPGELPAHLDSELREWMGGIFENRAGWGPSLYERNGRLWARCGFESVAAACEYLHFRTAILP